MTSPSTASTLDDWWSRRQSHSLSGGMMEGAMQPMACGSVIPPIGSPANLCAGDLPVGRILVVEDEMFVTLDLQRMLREAGFRIAGPATTLAEIQRLIERGPVGCALVHLDINRRTPLPVADLLAFADVPFVFMTTGGRTFLPREHAH